MQTYTSASTSINKNKIPAIYNNTYAIKYLLNASIIDIGGGKYDNAITYAKDNYNASVSVYDKYNRSARENLSALCGTYNIAVISNVLNVIDTKEERLNICKLALEYANTVLITVYEGDKTGIGRVTGSDSWQENRSTADYIDELKELNIEVIRKGKLIILKNRGK